MSSREGSFFHDSKTPRLKVPDRRCRDIARSFQRSVLPQFPSPTLSLPSQHNDTFVLFPGDLTLLGTKLVQQQPDNNERLN